MNFANLLHWTLVFLVVALICGLLGFTGIAGTAVGLAKILFWIAIILAILAFIGNTMRRA
jgi:uncharacterized membrane protein YtjA (UPF0391 family)